MTEQLRIFRIGPDTLSAYSIEDAKQVLRETYGSTYEGEELEGEEWEEVPDYEEITVTWTDGDFDKDKAGVHYPEYSWVEFVAIYRTPYARFPRFELEQISPECGRFRVRAKAKEWAELRRGIVCSSEY